jgi:DNA-binding NarL/FixJ family response regulator
MTVRVLIVDDNPVVRMGLSSLLGLDERIEVCGEASSGPEARELAERLRPDVVLLDVRMPGGGGLDALAELSQIAKVLMLTYTDEPAVVAQALAGGATGYLVHGAFQSDELVLAITDTAAGRPRLSPQAAAVLVHGLGRRDREPERVASEGVAPEVVARFRLSRRETDICELLVRGRSNTQIAHELFIEEKTVKNHINRIFAKLGAGNRSEAIAICLGSTDAAGRF